MSCLEIHLLKITCADEMAQKSPCLAWIRVMPHLDPRNRPTMLTSAMLKELKDTVTMKYTCTSECSGAV